MIYGRNVGIYDRIRVFPFSLTRVGSDLGTLQVPRVGSGLDWAVPGLSYWAGSTDVIPGPL